jgi:hypothetical protein
MQNLTLFQSAIALLGAIALAIIIVYCIVNRKHIKSQL